MALTSFLPEPVWVFFAALVGLAFGSFAGLVVYRLPKMVMGETHLTLSHPASHCSACGHTLRWWHNLPVVSYVWLRGRCGFCGEPIGKLNLFLELALGALWAGLVWGLGPTPKALIWAAFFSVLLVLSVIDWQTMLLPDLLTLPLIGAGVLCAYWQLTGLTWQESGLAASLGFAMLWLAAFVFERMRGAPGMGGGDAKLMSALGAWLGLQSLVWLLLCSSLIHVAWAILSARFKWGVGRSPDLAIKQGVSPNEVEDGGDVPLGAVPFGPALVLAAVLVWAASAGAQTFHASGPAYPFKVSSVQNADSAQVVARNDGAAVVSVEVHVTGSNLTSDRSWPAWAVVPPYSSVVLGNVSPAQPGLAMEIGIRSSRAFGDVNAPLDPSPFALPFSDGQQFEISQAYGGQLTTHRDLRVQHAVDFDMPEGTPVLAAREGLVVDLQAGFTRGGLDASLEDKANVIKILHPDGTVAIYAHLSARPFAVSLGQTVRSGDLLAYSGNTGYSSGPHLHFCVAKPTLFQGSMMDMCQPVRFVTGTPPQTFVPQEGLIAQASRSGPVALTWARTGPVPAKTTPWIDVKEPQAVGWSANVLAFGGWFLTGVMQRTAGGHVPIWLWLVFALLMVLGLLRAFR